MFSKLKNFITKMTQWNSVYDTVLLISIAVIIVVFLDSVYEMGYKDGHVDGLTGKIRYELTMHEDSTRTWEEIKTNKNN